MKNKLLPNGVAYGEIAVSMVGKTKTPSRLAERLPRELGAKVGAPAPAPSGMGRVVRRKAASDI